MINSRIAQLRKLMVENNIDAYVIPTADFHESEYVGEYFKSRKYISGFTGSAGSVVVTKDEVGLWVDGRYFIQGEQQIRGTCITLYKMAEEGVPTIEDYLVKSLPHGGTLGFDGRVINSKLGVTLEEKLASKDIMISYEEDLVGLVWGDRPELSKQPAFLLGAQYAGKSANEKIDDLRKIMEDKKADVHILTSLDDIAWLLNIRGNDVDSNPVVLSHLAVTREEIRFFVHEEVLSNEIKDEFAFIGITVRPYDEVYDFVKTIEESKTVLLDKKRINYRILRNLPTSVTILDEVNPTTTAKAIKNPVELDNIRLAHIKDGVAFTKFMYWLKKNVGKMKITEITASDYLEDCRKEQPNFIEKSFTTIAGYKEHAAMMHYSATKESDYELQGEGMFLVDSGGQYYEGTTDITRTIVLGELSKELKLQFTTVARCNINLAKARFLYGCTGANLDILARGPLWDMDMDYKCGTGHGIGYVLNVHEGPNNFFWRITPNRNYGCVFEEGMVTTDEPGIYIEGSHGIRIENELICKKGVKNEYGQYMYFENVTYAPIDLDGIDVSYLTKEELNYLNDYHKTVYEKLAPHMTEVEREWLKEYTRSV